MKGKYVTINTQPLDDILQATLAFYGVFYALAVMQDIDTRVVLHGVYKGEGAMWNDPITGKRVPVTVITKPDEVPTFLVRLAKYDSPNFTKQIEYQEEEHPNGKEKKNYSITLTVLVETTKAMQYIINGTNGTLSPRKMIIAIKCIQLLSTNTLQAISGVHINVCLLGVAILLDNQTAKIEAELQKEGVNMKYMGTCLPEIHLSRQIPHELSVEQRYI